MKDFPSYPFQLIRSTAVASCAFISHGSLETEVGRRCDASQGHDPGQESVVNMESSAFQYAAISKPASSIIGRAKDAPKENQNQAHWMQMELRHSILMSLLDGIFDVRFSRLTSKFERSHFPSPDSSHL
jgi:hypothetical protein